MCGLFGYKTNVKHNGTLSAEQKGKRKRIIEALAMAMQDRGKDSTGIAIINGSEAKLIKDAIESTRFVDDKRFQKAVLSSPAMLIGHTRYATVGEVNKENAHPFRRGKIVGAHNGSVSNYLTIDSKVNVDSEVIFSLLKENDNDYKKSFKRLSGQFAITWSYLEENDVLYCVKDGNPLYMSYVPSMKTMFWCSHQSDLNTILRAALGAEKYEWTKLEDERVYRFDERLRMKKYKISFKDEPTYSYSGYDYSSSYSGYKSSKIWTPKQKKLWTLEDDERQEAIEYNRAFGRAITGYEDYDVEEEEEPQYEYDKDGQLILQIDLFNDLKRRVFEEGCVLCNEGIAEDKVWYDAENDQMYCETCKKSLENFPEYRKLEPVELF